LSGSLDGFGSNVALLNHPLLSDEDLLWWDLHTEVTTGNHDTINNLKDLIKVVEASLVLNLSDDLDVLLTRIIKDLADGLNVLSGLHKGGSDHVNVLSFTEDGNVVLILFKKNGEIDNSSGQVHVLALTKDGVVHNFDHHRFLFELGNCANERAVSNEDSAANFHGLGELFVRASEHFGGTQVGEVSGQL